VFSDSLADRRRPDRWQDVPYAETKLLYHHALEPLVYIIPVNDILGRLALVPMIGTLLRTTISEECVIKGSSGSGFLAEVLSTTSVHGQWSGLLTIPAILADKLDSFF
jgi:hypothetical protein